jgi:hypothetical protein
MTKQIQLTQGQVAIVDDWWFDELNQHKWFADWSRGNKSFYATRTPIGLFGKQTIRMHTVVAGTPKGFHTDHINHDTLDNRSENLRICTHSQNQMNKGKRSDNTSGYKGVRKCGNSWQAQISTNKNNYYLGSYSTPEEAARAYDEAAKRLCGEFAALNFQ